MVIGALEAGGTKMVCAVGNEKGKIFEQVSIPTESPEVTKSETYGYITSTPKIKWRNYKRALNRV